MILALAFSIFIVTTEITSAQIVLNFCSGRSVEVSVQPRSVVKEDGLLQDIPSETKLYLDGSDTALASSLYRTSGLVSCTCTIKNSGQPVPGIYIQHIADSINRSCGKSVEARIGERVMYRFGCASTDLEIQNVSEHENIFMTLYVNNPRPSDEKYKLAIEPVVVTAKLQISCWAPVLPVNTTSSVATSSTSTYSTVSTTANITPTTIVSSGPTDKVVFVGVVTSVMVTVIVVLVCFLCFLVVRKRNQKKNGQSATERDAGEGADRLTKQGSPFHRHLRNTVSHIYASIRSIPTIAAITQKVSLPKNALGGLRGRTQIDKDNLRYAECTRASGLYDSIKSNPSDTGSVLKKTKIDSTVVLPMSGVDKLALTGHDSCKSEYYIHATITGPSKPHQSVQVSAESHKYLTPVIENNRPLKVNANAKETDQEIEPSFIENNLHDTEDYLEPLKCKSDYTEKSHNVEEPYTVMKYNDSKSLNDTYMTGRPRYIESIKNGMSKNVLSTTTPLESRDNEISAAYVNLKNALNVSKYDSQEDDLPMTTDLVSKMSISAQPSGDYIPMDSSNTPTVSTHSGDQSILG